MNILNKLGFQLKHIPRPRSHQVIWVHAVSLGEMKASLPLLQKCKREWPEAEIYFSTTTVTAYNQTKNTLKECIDHLFYLPLDFPWIVQRYVRKLRPNMLILVETDFWPELIREVKKRGGDVVTVNGKISLRSWQRLKKWPFISRWIFSKIDLICCQSLTYQERFLSLGIPANNLLVTGNLKYDAMPAPKFLLTNVEPLRPFITLASTHEGEESGLLKALASLPPEVCFFVTPRHPERFSRVEALLQELGLSYDKFSVLKDGLQQTDKRVVLIDAMGVLDKCYALSRVVIVGGSFVPGIGGHNIYEPVRFYKSVVFGPFMHNQEELVKDILLHQAAVQTNFAEVEQVIKTLLQSPIDKAKLENLEKFVKGATDRTFAKIEELLVARKHLPC